MYRAPTQSVKKSFTFTEVIEHTDIESSTQPLFKTP